MFDPNQFNIPWEKKSAIAVSDSDWGLEEIEGLFTTLGGQVKEKVKVNLRKIDPKSYLGAGKVQEIANLVAESKADVLLLDFDLSPTQLKNIEAIDKGLVMDRAGIILEIFSRHARSKEAKLQVEVAKLEYLMPRLAHLWSHFERQSGAGGTAMKGKGMGETQIEVDRRLVKDRINMLRGKLKEAEKSRSLHRRSRADLLQVALVGYTNAGKSTLLNALTRSDVLVEDALFATLDASIRLLNPKSRPAVLAIDTVGFIDRLPHSLVASFRSTLDAVLEADLLLHVLDASHPEVQRQYEVTVNVLKELEADNIPVQIVFNKVDQAKNLQILKVWAASLAREANLLPPIFMSAYNKDDVDALRESIFKYFERQMQTFEIVVPFEDGKTLAQIHELGRVEQKRSVATGTFVRFKTMEVFAKKLNFERYRV